MSLSQRLLLGSLLIIGVLVTLVVVIVDGRLRRGLTEEALVEITRQARLVGAQWTAGMDADSLADASAQALEHRVTLIATDGRVLGDSEFDGEELARLENHAGRPEVLAATTVGRGSARRLSVSSGHDEVYAAIRTVQGIARVSLEMETLEATFRDARRDVLGAAIVTLLVAIVLVTLFSRSVARPVTELRDVARGLAAGDLSRRPSLDAPGEVGQLAGAVHQLAEQLSARLAALEAAEGLLVSLTESLH